jgi:GNAT superfamily N-acetyltransferase
MPRLARSFIRDIASDEATSDFAGFLAPALRHLLAPDHRVLRLGARSTDGVPIALAVSMAGPERMWELASLHVTPLFRRRGLGRALLTESEAGMAALARDHGVHFCTIDAEDQGYARFLMACGWSRPKPRQLLCHASLDQAERISWLMRAQPGRLDRIIRWGDVPPSARAEIAAIGLPFEVDPMAHEEDCDGATSVALMRGAQPLGWVITHQVAPDLLRWTCSYVRTDLGVDLQGAGRILPLWSAVARRQRRDTAMDRFVWTVPFSQPRMARFAARRLRPWLCQMGYACVSERHA